MIETQNLPATPVENLLTWHLMPARLQAQVSGSQKPRQVAAAVFARQTQGVQLPLLLALDALHAGPSQQGLPLPVGVGLQGPGARAHPGDRGGGGPPWGPRGNRPGAGPP